MFKFKELESSEDILTVLQEIRESLIELFLSAGSDPKSGRKSARQLELDRNLAWRIARIASSDDLLGAVQDVPTPKHIERICEACKANGAPVLLAERAAFAVAKYDEYVFKAAGNREHFEALVSSLAQDDVTTQQEGVRKAAFFANLAQWGVQSRLDFKTVIYAPSSSGSDSIDIVRLGGLVDFKRSRQVSWPIYSNHWYSDDGKTMSVEMEPLFESIQCQRTGTPLIEEFCSDPTPELLVVDTPYGSRIDLPVTKFGNAGSITSVFGDIHRNAAEKWRCAKNRFEASMNDLYTPTEMVVHDVFLHRDLTCFGEPEVMLLDRLSAARGYNPNVDEQHKLPLSKNISRISAGRAGCSLRQFEQYADLIQTVFDRIEHTASDFVGFRFALSHPPIPSAVILRFALPEGE